MTKPLSEPCIDSEHRAWLEAEAVQAAAGSYAPYSNFHVGAAALGRSGKVYRGANVENASYGLGTCAERVALANAKVAQEEEIVAIAIACVDAKPGAPLGERMPCGACRQWIKELAPQASIIVAGVSRTFTVEDLIPNAFTLHTPSSG
jgi:cytidine deaminase